MRQFGKISIIIFVLVSSIVSVIISNSISVDGGVNDHSKEEPKVACRFDERYLSCPPFPIDDRHVFLTGYLTVQFPILYPEDVNCIVTLSFSSLDLIFNNPPPFVLTTDDPKTFFNISLKIPESKKDESRSFVESSCYWETSNGVQKGQFPCSYVYASLDDFSILSMEIEVNEIVIDEYEEKEISLAISNSGFGGKFSVITITDDDTLRMEIVNDYSYFDINDGEVYVKIIRISHESSYEGTSELTIVVEALGPSSTPILSENVTIIKKVEGTHSKSNFNFLIMPFIIFVIILSIIDVPIAIFIIYSTKKKTKENQKLRDFNGMVK